MGKMQFVILYKTTTFGVTPCGEADIHNKHYMYTATRKQAINRVTALRMAGVNAWFEPLTAKNWQGY